MSVVRYFILIVINQHSIVRIVRHFILIALKYNSVVSVVSEENQRNEHIQIFHFDSSEVKQHRECSQ